VTFNLTKSKRFLADMLTIIGRAREAERPVREALAEIEPLALRRSQYKLMVGHLGALNETLGDCLFAQGRFTEAHEAYVQAQDIRRRDYEAVADAPAQTGATMSIYLLVLCPDKSVRDPAAAAGIARAELQRTPRNQYLWGDLGASLYQTGDWPGAIHAFEMWQQIGPRDLGCMRYVLALAQFKAGQPELARASLAQAEHWAATTPPRYREPRFFAPEARQVILGNATLPAASTVPTTRLVASGSRP
jgi:tetratricopeptide (TPR) repeat protein